MIDTTLNFPKQTIISMSVNTPSGHVHIFLFYNKTCNCKLSRTLLTLQQTPLLLTPLRDNNGYNTRGNQ